MNVYERDDPNDQAPLQNLIKKYPLKQRKTMVNAMNTTHFMYDGGTFVKHFIRVKQTWATNERLLFGMYVQSGQMPVMTCRGESETQKSSDFRHRG